MKSVLALARSNIARLVPYESARSLTTSGRIFLDANEAPEFQDELGSGDRLNRYPEPQPRALVDRFSQLYGVAPSSILISRGSDEALDLIFRAFCEPGEDEILTCPPTYGMYEVSAKIQGTGLCQVPLLQSAHGFSLDETGIRNALESNPNLKAVFLCAPNNPTGTGIAPESLVRICQMTLGKCLVVVDEAYNEFSLYPSMTRYIANFPHLVVLRTLSKAWASAGIRCGVALGQKEVIQLLHKVRPPYPLPTPCVQAILDATNEERQLALLERVQETLAEREALRSQLKQNPEVLTVYPSDSNFILVKFKSSKLVFASLKANGIIVRDRSKELGLENCIRITIGNPAENRALVSALMTFSLSKKSPNLLIELGVADLKRSISA